MAEESVRVHVEAASQPAAAPSTRDDAETATDERERQHLLSFVKRSPHTATNTGTGTSVSSTTTATGTGKDTSMLPKIEAPNHPWKWCLVYTFVTLLTVAITVFFTLGFVYREPLLGPLFFASILPTFLILWLAYRNPDATADDELHFYTNMIPPELLIIAFGGGALVTALVAVAGLLLTALSYTVIGKSMNVLELTIFVIVEAFILVALVEETAKFLIARIAVGKTMSQYVKHPYGVVLFGLATALGFACIENVAYVTHEDSSGSGWYLALMRALLSVPLHGTTGALIGIGLAYRFYFGERSRTFWSIIFLPVLIHGTYDCVFMLPLRSGAFIGGSDTLESSKNTVNIGDWLILLHLFNVVLVIASVAYAKQQAGVLCEKYDKGLKDSAKAVY